MTVLFWTSAIFVAYVYLGYPLLLASWARVRGSRRVRRDDTFLPGVSIVIAARNEAARLPARLRNLLALDYPADRCQIIVVSDGSNDDTASAIAGFNVDFVALPPCGKAAALNAGVARATHDILVFADARQSFSKSALRALTAPLADRSVGGVSGELLLGCEPATGRRSGIERRAPAGEAASRDQRITDDRRRDRASSVGDGIGLYWTYEKTLRRLESDIWSTLGATGAIYALRRSLWTPLPDGTILDDVLAPMRAVLAGSRVVFEDAAQAFDHTPADSITESRRKVRTLAGNVQILRLEPRLLLPIVNPVWLQYVSHKIGRLLVPYALMVLMSASIVLTGRHPVYTAALLLQCAFYLLGGYGALLEWRHRAIPAAAPLDELPIEARVATPADREFQTIKDVVNA